MSVVSRMTRFGRLKTILYRRSRSRYASRWPLLEQVGIVDPLAKETMVKINEERIKYWIGVGAKPSDTVAQIIQQIPGYWSGLEESV